MICNSMSIIYLQYILFAPDSTILEESNRHFGLHIQHRTIPHTKVSFFYILEEQSMLATEQNKQYTLSCRSVWESWSKRVDSLNEQM